MPFHSKKIQQLEVNKR